MPQVGFEPTIPVFERAKTVRAIDRATVVIDYSFLRLLDIRLEYGVIMYYLVLHKYIVCKNTGFSSRRNWALYSGNLRRKSGVFSNDLVFR
jgi:hypothetical protein